MSERPRQEDEAKPPRASKQFLYDYAVLYDEIPTALSERVTAYLNEGYTLVGGIAVGVTRDGMYTTYSYAQAVMKVS